MRHWGRWPCDRTQGLCFELGLLGRCFWRIGIAPSITNCKFKTEEKYCSCTGYIVIRMMCQLDVGFWPLLGTGWAKIGIDTAASPTAFTCCGIEVTVNIVLMYRTEVTIAERVDTSHTIYIGNATAESTLIASCERRTTLRSRTHKRIISKQFF